MPFGARVQPFGALLAIDDATGCGTRDRAGTIAGVASVGRGAYNEVQYMSEWGKI
jgi:hypothetical protein